MESTMQTQDFNQKSTLLPILFNFLIRTQNSFFDKKIYELTGSYVRKFIENEGVIVKSCGKEKLIKSHSHQIYNGDEIQIPKLNVIVKCKKNPVYSDVEELPYFHKIDALINNFLIEKLKTNNFKEIKSENKKLAFALVVDLIQEHTYEVIKQTQFGYPFMSFIQTAIKDTDISKELDIEKNQLNLSGILIELLINGKLEKYKQLEQLKQNLLNHAFDSTIYNYLQAYRRIYKSEVFSYLINPLVNNEISNQLKIENLVHIINEIKNCKDLENKFNHFEKNKITFITYLEILKNSNVLTKNLFEETTNYLFDLLKIKCDTASEKPANIVIESINRKYNFSNVLRSQQDLHFLLSNNGEGLAKNISITSKSDLFEFNQDNVGILLPKQSMEVKIFSKINFCPQFEPQVIIRVEWEEISGKKCSNESLINFLVQKHEIPWEEIRRKKPYSMSIIDTPEKLFGRTEILEELSLNIINEDIESYKLWGQKRVGKSSIVKTLKSMLDSEEKIIIVYRTLGGLKNIDASKTFNSLGESLCSEIYGEIEKISDSIIREKLKSISYPPFNGSFLPLEDYIKKLKRIDPDLKFIFILDEFDRINAEFFLPGELGDTLSLSIGKGLNENNFVGFILVGSENMHLIDKQGINYNCYQEREVDIFHKEREFDSFIQIIRGPVAPFINYTDESIERIFYESNGNPYFANLICTNIFQNSYRLKDSEIDIQFVEDAISAIINSSQKNHFEHFWSDGILEENTIKREKKSDIRKRILMSFSSCARPLLNEYPTQSDILRNFKFPIEKEYEIERYEIENTITEFFKRKIFTNNNSQIRILPPIFEKWLCESGKTSMIEGISDLEALQRQINLEKELSLKTSEIARLSDNYHFKGEVISKEIFFNYFNQFGGATEQRRIFKLIDAIYYISKDEIVKFFREEKRNIFTRSEFHLKERARTVFKEKVELYTFSNYYEEKRQVVDSFKLLNNVRAQKALRIIEEDPKAWKKNGSEEVLIIEPVIENFDKIRKELFLLLNDEIKNSNISIRIITFIITTKAKSDLITATSTFTNLKLISLREVEETQIKPFIENTEIFENREELNSAFYEVKKHFAISRDVLLVLFEDFCPSKTCPILWFSSPQFTPLFSNEFGILEEVINENEEEKRRDKLYFISKEFSQKMNQFIINYLKTKAREGGGEDWFTLKYIPRKTYDNVSKKWLDDSQKDSIETYFDFIDYKDIINYNKSDNFLNKKFMIGEKEQLNWMNRCNELRRDPAHPEKPCPTQEDVDYFEKIKNTILPRLH